MILMSFCLICEAENYVKSRGSKNRHEFVALNGSTYVDLKCKSCKQQITVHVDEMMAQEGYLMFYLIPIGVITFMVLHFALHSSDSIYAFVPVMTLITFIGKSISNNKTDQVAEFNRSFVNPDWTKPEQTWKGRH